MLSFFLWIEFLLANDKIISLYLTIFKYICHGVIWLKSFLLAFLTFSEKFFSRGTLFFYSISHTIVFVTLHPPVFSKPSPVSQCLTEFTSLYIDLGGITRKGKGCSMWPAKWSVCTKMVLPKEISVSLHLAQPEHKSGIWDYLKGQNMFLDTPKVYLGIINDLGIVMQAEVESKRTPPALSLA